MIGYQTILFFFIILSCTRSSPQALTGVQNTNSLKDEVEAIDQDPNYLIAGEPILAVAHLVDFYRQREYQAAWIGGNKLSITGQELIAVLANADEEGLTPDDYHLAKIRQLSSIGNKVDHNSFLIHLELLLTDAYLTFAAHLYNGKVCPEKVDSTWHADCKKKEINYSDYLIQAVASPDIMATLDRLKPHEPAYQQLKATLAYYRQLERDLQGVFPAIKPKAKTATDYNLLHIAFLEERLIALGDLSKGDRNDPDKIEQALARFQARHGLKAGGIDSITVKTLNTSITERIQTIETNLERWRWLPLDLGKNYILVNIAGFNLAVYEEDEVVFNSGVIVGTPYHRTPVFSADMTHLILNPYWHVPRSIINNEILTLSQPGAYLKRNLIQILDPAGDIISPDSINWSGSFPYRLRQDPGLHNFLGLIKFMSPNPYSVYIHDTPTKKLFDRSVRTFSHGCIRLQKPFELAEYLLKDDPEWDMDTLREATSSASLKNRRINLPTPIPVHVLYWTAWMDVSEVIHFREDIYHRDRAVWKALKDPPTVLM